MPFAVVQLVSRLPSVSGLPADTCENVINLGQIADPLDLADVTDAMEAFRDFYLVATGQTAAIASRISETIDRTASACSILAYTTPDATGGTDFGSPIASLNFTMAATPGTDPMPEEAAVVLSFNGDLTDVPVSITNPAPPPATIRPQARRRGRIFIGPLQNNSGTVQADPFWRPSAALRSDLGIAFDRMFTEIAATGNLYLGVWSKADAEVWEAVGGYVDNAWDTQRRRGPEATLRDSFVL